MSLEQFKMRTVVRLTRHNFPARRKKPHADIGIKASVMVPFRPSYEPERW